MARYHFEDFQVGDAWDFGRWSVSREELIAFARAYDPQPIHLDDGVASRTAFGGVIASGWQTVLQCIRLFVDGLMRDTAGLASPGLDEIRWLKPVRAGDVITTRAEVLEVAESRSRPDRGRVHFLIYGVDAAGERVASARGPFFVAKRSGAWPEAPAPAEPAGAPRPRPRPTGERAIILERYTGSWPPDDPDAEFRRMVTEYSRLDPLPTLETLSRSKDIPLGALARFVLARYATSGSEALLEMGPRVVRQMDDVVRKAESAGTDEARLRAYRALAAIVSWLQVPLSDPGWRPGDHPGD